MTDLHVPRLKLNIHMLKSSFIIEVNYMEISKFLSYIYLYLTPAVIL